VAVRWTKLGQVCTGGWNLSWASTHAAAPIVERISDRAVHVYFTARDEAGRSHIGAGELNLDRLSEGLRAFPDPVLRPGHPGAFDESGVTTSSIVVREGKRFLYYTGWTQGMTVPFYFYAGLAVAQGDGSFVRVSRAPILERSEVDPFLTASPWVLVEDGLWRMWYVSGVRWDTTPRGPKHLYNIKYAESRNGVDWTRLGRVCVDFATPGEHAFGRPCVVKEPDGRYRMWYSYRGEGYRIGYADSADGITWERKDDQAGIDPSPSGWDAEMIEYPVVFDAAGRRYMLYNGNGYGRSGMGLAVLDTPQ